MTTKVEKLIVVDVPVTTAYNQWTQFEDFPRFMKGVEEVRQLNDEELHWVAEIAGVRREWTARILEQVPDQKVSWAAEEGVLNAGTVTFQPAGEGRAEVHLTLEYEPVGFLETLGDKLKIVEQQAEGDLKRFKEFIESQGHPTGAWRGQIPDDSSVGAHTSDQPGGLGGGVTGYGSASSLEESASDVSDAETRRRGSASGRRDDTLGDQDVPES